MTITTIYNASNLGTTTNLINQGATQTVLQTGTTAVILNAKVISGPEKINPSDSVRLYYTISPFNISSGVPTAFSSDAVGCLDIKVPQSSTQVIKITGVIVNNGGYLYTWWDSPALQPGGGTASTLTVTSVELP